MKLIKLYIENFGKISKTEYDFSDNLTCFCEENGFGKTTIATFIKVMFYGMPIVKTNSKFNDREHYYPFDGGKFGGNLTFEKDGKIYKIVRFFDKKSEKKDEVYFYENDNLVEKIPDSIGKFVFSVDESSFLRTLYFNELSSSVNASSDITLKLTGIVEGEDDYSYENAKKKLEEASKKLKRTGSKGEIFDLSKEINITKEEIQNLKTISNSLNAKYQNKDVLETRLKTLELELKKVSDDKIKLDNFKTYESYLNEAENVKLEIEKISKDYPLGMPTDNEMIALNKSANNISGIESQKAYVKQDVKLNNELETLEKTFVDGVPTEGDLENFKSDVNLLLETKTSKNGRVKNMPLLLIGILEIIISCILLFTNLTLGIIFLSVGIVFISTSLLVSGNDKNAGKNQEISQKLANFLDKYGIKTQNYLDGLYELKSKIDRYNFIKNQILNANIACDKLDKEFEENLSLIKQIFNKYNIILLDLDSLNEQLKGIEKDILYVKNKSSILDSIVKRANAYKLEKNITAQPSSEISSYDDVYIKCENLRSEITALDRDIKNCEDTLEILSEKQNKLLILEENLEKLQKRYNDITLALEFLVSAEQSLKNKYINPVKQSFITYAEILEKILGEKVIMDKNFQIYFERSGENKSREHLSSGQNVLCDLCLRLALVDNMYKGENPFIILDDPFSLLDENHIAKALKLIKELSSNRQIIYFVCHESRKI